MTKKKNEIKEKNNKSSSSLKKKENTKTSGSAEGKSEEFKEKIVQIDRVARVVKGGRRFRFRAVVVVGNEKGKVGIGVGKGTEVSLAVQKAKAKAQKNMISVHLQGSTIPHEIQFSFGGAKVFLKPASPGTGVIAGGAVRAVVELAGIKDILSKILGSTNKVNNVQAAFLALKNLKILSHLRDSTNGSQSQTTTHK